MGGAGDLQLLVGGNHQDPDRSIPRADLRDSTVADDVACGIDGDAQGDQFGAYRLTDDGRMIADPRSEDESIQAVEHGVIGADV